MSLVALVVAIAALVTALVALLRLRQQHASAR
jgi:hypothetical protein